MLDAGFRVGVSRVLDEGFRVGVSRVLYLFPEKGDILGEQYGKKCIKDGV